MKLHYLLPIFFSLFLGCKTDAPNQENGSSSNSKTTEVKKDEIPPGLIPLIQQAKEKGATPTATRVNFASGYWHLGGAVNATEVGDNRSYEGIWFKMDENHLLTVGKDNDMLYQGAWAWDEELQYLTFMAPLKDDWFLAEWRTMNRGDIYICIGGTPTNSSGAQFKLVRKQDKFLK